ERHRQDEGAEGVHAKPSSEHGGSYEGSAPGDHLGDKHNGRIAQGPTQRAHSGFPPAAAGVTLVRKSRHQGDASLSSDAGESSNAGRRTSTPSMQPRKIIERE